LRVERRDKSIGHNLKKNFTEYIGEKNATLTQIGAIWAGKKLT
jgi:hypothetical protein